MNNKISTIIENVDIIIPIYNPHDKWLAKIDDQLSRLVNSCQGFRFRLIIVNDGNENLDPDKIKLESIPSEFLKIVNYPGNKGKGFAIRKGLAYTTSEIVIFTDLDIPYGYKSIENFILKVKEGYDVVLPKRDISYFNKLPVKRRLVSKALICLNQWLLGLEFPDTQGGIKGIGPKAIPILLEGKENGFLFEIEWIKKAQKIKLKSGTIPVTLDPEISFSSFEIGSLLNLGWRYLRLLLSH